MPVHERRKSNVSRLWQWSALRWGVRCSVLLTVAMIGSSAAIYFYSRSLMFATIDRSVIEQLELLGARPPDMLPFLVRSRLQRPGPVLTNVGLFDSSGQPVAGDIDTLTNNLKLDGGIHEITAAADGTLLHAAGRRLADGETLVVARSVDEIYQMLTDLQHVVLMFILPTIAASLAVGLWMGRKTDLRIRALNGRALPVLEGDLTVRLPVQVDGDEIDRLSSIVNTILDRLEIGVEALTNVGENIAHDIRTPLTAVRMRLERARASAADGCELAQLSDFALKGLDQALGTVTGLLRVADIQHRVRASGFENVDLGSLISETVEIFEPLAESHGLVISCRVSGGEPLMVWADRQLLIEALANLIDNAIKFTPASGKVVVALGGSAAAPTISVSDTGIGIPLTETAAVFERFVRLDRSRTTPGSGLGLSLVAAIAQLHGLEISLRANNPGTTVTLSFPLRAAWEKSAATKMYGTNLRYGN